MKRSKLIFATVGIILAGAGALDILGDKSVPTDTVQIASVGGDTMASRSGHFRIEVPRTVSCPIDESAIHDR
ncbi:hypothetical protein [Nocardia bovistercoris]|uniref:Uncharacterized protein n=1 Tax=Nocardia bovistercoris TaxID=2785916 RepID=A0A931IAV0_9NOCA|nr:hypothetical protein [Nocardia bovistercoris]MBH0776463.1 hypothetical protein [Nocardia bovistercoris]